jgi:peptidoglycan hydrolase-like protein with peptidoglycan-binding domain
MTRLGGRPAGLDTSDTPDAPDTARVSGGGNGSAHARGNGGPRVSRPAVALTVAVAIAAGAAGGGWAYGYGPFSHHGAPSAGNGQQPAAAVPLSTAVVQQGTLRVREDDAGTVGYPNPVTVYAAATGTLTWVPAPGTGIRNGHPLFAVDGQGVMLLRGGTPAWRSFYSGMTDGPDVTELQRDLIALGYDPYRAVTVDGVYDWATEAAVERWQTALGWTVTGELALGQVVFMPGPVQVSQQLAEAGAAVSPGTQVLDVTSTTPVVTVTLTAGEEYAVRPGQRVDVTLPDGSVTSGHVLSVSTTSSSAPSGSGGSGGSGGSSASGGGSGQSQPQTTAVVQTTRPLTRYNGASVQVAVTTAEQRSALIVPISALLAGPGGSYQVTVVSGGRTRNVTVTPGLFDDVDSQVAISGPGITAGATVEVPSS